MSPEELTELRAKVEDVANTYEGARVHLEATEVLHLFHLAESYKDAWDAARRRAEAAEAKVAAAREIAHRLHSDYYLADVITESIDRADNIANELDVALDTHTPETETP